MRFQRLPSQLTKRPTLSARNRTQQRRHNSSNPPPSQEHNHANTPSTPPKTNTTSSSSPPPSGTAASAGGSPTPPVAAAIGSRSLGQIIQAGPLGKLGRSYARVQERRPYTTQVCSSIIIYLCGDLSAQFLFPTEGAGKALSEEEKDESERSGTQVEVSKGGGYDLWRTVRHLIIGVGSSIPTFKWFMFLHRNFNYASKFRSILTKVVVQQMVFTPVFNTYFFSLHSLLAGGSLVETFERLKSALPVSIKNSAKLWPSVTAFTFMYVPAQFRSIFSGCIAVGWQTYLSWLNQKAAREVAEAEAAELMASNSVLGASSAMLKA